MIFYFWIYTLLVILWGAWVRISHSGDGCGDHWPLCGGEIIPEFKHNKTWIEYAHRLMSGSYGLIVIYFFFKFRKALVSAFTKKLNVALLILMITEALLGAALVKGQLVTTNDSFTRLIVMGFHQLNSFLLTGVTFLFYLALKNEPGQIKLSTYKPFIFFLLLAVSGAIAALSTTLFPSISLFEGILNDFSTESHLFVRLRIIHPLLASTIATSFMWWLYMKNQSRAALEFLFAIFIGVITLLTLSPVYLKLAHLLIAHLLWARLFYLFVSSPDSKSV
ncbi:MAG: COX15/CtaA family protein [Bdellovibrio sp.]|nr:COX15/CtaA family protein [Bdellovibrio sp.]